MTNEVDPRWRPGQVTRRLADQARDWRESFEHDFPVDAWDPLAHLLRNVLHWDWLRVWLVAFLLYGPIEKLLIPYLGGYLNLQGPIHTWRPDLEALLNGFVEFPFFFAYYAWTGRGISELFVSLARNRSLRDGDRYAAFMRDVSRDFDRWQWPVLSLLGALVIAGVMHFVVWSPDAATPPWFGTDRLYPRIIALILIFLVGYALVQVLLRELLAVKWLRRLWRTMGDSLVVHPYHPDGAGGLGAVGRHAVSLSYFSLMFGLFVFMGSLLPSLREPGELALRLWSPAVVVVWVLYVVFVPSLFVLLLWPPHQSMRRQRDERLRAVAEEIERQLEVTEGNLDAGHDVLGPQVDRLGSLRQVAQTLTDAFPTWPVNPAVRHQLRLSTLIPILYSLLPILLDLLR